MTAAGELAEEAGVEPTEDACAPSNGFEARAPHRERYSSAFETTETFPAASKHLLPSSLIGAPARRGRT